MAYRIWCKVSGGVTGTRTGWQKDPKSATGYAEYDTLEEAETAAARHTARMNTPFSRAYFVYTVVQEESGGGFMYESIEGPRLGSPSRNSRVTKK